MAHGIVRPTFRSGQAIAVQLKQVPVPTARNSSLAGSRSPQPRWPRDASEGRRKPGRTHLRSCVVIHRRLRRRSASIAQAPAPQPSPGGGR